MAEFEAMSDAQPPLQSWEAGPLQLTTNLGRGRFGASNRRDDPVPMSDNSILSDIDRPLQDPSSAANLAVAQYVLASRALNTHRAYGSDLADFQAWGGHIPSTPAEVTRYLAQRAPSYRPSTLRRRLAALATIHRDHGFPDPTKSALVRRVVQGIERKHGVATHQVTPLMIEDLTLIVAKMGDAVDDARDRAILLVGFFGAFRRAELVALKVNDLQITDTGAQATLCRSKTDQRGHGRTVFLARRNDTLCPVRATELWLSAAGPDEGFLFPAARSGGATVHGPLSARSIARIIKRRVTSIGLDPACFSGHSLRAGFITSAALAGIEGPAIANQTGHRSQQSLSDYVRLGYRSGGLLQSVFSMQVPSRASGHVGATLVQFRHSLMQRV